ncbi:MAG TPA: sugar phosphate isomerase/epimerase family protein [Bryobacteraceae bacterium]|nr:sugar phosphate isomerase/epimerase family protein [Bryobacteraceae bacterium]
MALGQVGLMFWAGRDPAETLREVQSLGINTGQLGIPGDLVLDDAVKQAWKKALDEAGFTVVTVFAAYNGEDYADIPTVQRTVGFIPPATREERERRTCEISDMAAALEVKSIACHIGFVPEDHADPDYIAVREMVRRVADYAAKNGQTFALETGQEPAPVLVAFMKDVHRPNLRVNFDPANMILYGTGDPIEALEVVAPYVVSVHCKDGDWPPKDKPDALGTERALGDGAVGMDRYVAKLKAVGYTGPLNIEREIPDHQQRLEDIRKGAAILNRLRV